MIRSTSIFTAFPICSESCFGKRVKNDTDGPGEMPGLFLFSDFFISDYAQLFTKIIWFFCLFFWALNQKMGAVLWIWGALELKGPRGGIKKYALHA